MLAQVYVWEVCLRPLGDSGSLLWCLLSLKNHSFRAVPLIHNGLSWLDARASVRIYLILRADEYLDGTDLCKYRIVSRLSIHRLCLGARLIQSPPSQARAAIHALAFCKKAVCHPL